MTLSSRWVDQPQLRLPKCHHFIVCRIRSLLVGEFPRRQNKIDLIFELNECVSPHSPEVASPADLGLLLTISPIIITSIDF